jgi:hypothetical protein
VNRVVKVVGLVADEKEVDGQVVARHVELFPRSMCNGDHSAWESLGFLPLLLLPLQPRPLL